MDSGFSDVDIQIPGSSEFFVSQELGFRIQSIVGLLFPIPDSTSKNFPIPESELISSHEAMCFFFVFCFFILSNADELRVKLLTFIVYKLTVLKR